MSGLQKSPDGGRKDKERGFTTAEYAVGTVAAVTMVGVLIKIFMSPEFWEILWQIVKWIIELIQSMGG